MYPRPSLTTLSIRNISKQIPTQRNQYLLIHTNKRIVFLISIAMMFLRFPRWRQIYSFLIIELRRLASTHLFIINYINKANNKKEVYYNLVF